MHRISVVAVALILLLLPVVYAQQADTPAPDALPAVSPTPMPQVTIAAVGDMMLGNWGVEKLRINGVNYPFEQVAPYLQKADITTGNLEGPHCNTGEAHPDKKYTFRIPPQWMGGYKWAGFDVVTLSNNHAMDFGGECLLECIDALSALGIKKCGGGKNLSDANQPAVIEKNGVKVAFLGYSATYPKDAWATPGKPGTVFPEHNLLVQTVQKAAAENDLLVVQFHWGEEGRADPKEYQVNLAHLVIDNGADLVIGHHPHILQGVESYKGRLIFYSLGNFTFASYSTRAKTSAIAQVALNKDGSTVSAKVVPVNVYNYDVQLQPVPMPGDSAVIGELRAKSSMIKGGIAASIADDGTVNHPETP